MESFQDDGLLFPIDDFIAPDLLLQAKNREREKEKAHAYRKKHCNNLDICLSIDSSGSFGMAQLSSYTGDIPRKIIPFTEAVSSKAYDCGVHFYIDDYGFERIWTNPTRYIPILKRFSCVIGPDFSQFCDMSYPMRMWNCYRNRVISSELQKNGVSVIPNVTWSLPDSYEYSFSGIPIGGTIAINCTSIIHCNLSKYLWYKGYEQALSRLTPTRIIRYGSVMPGERTGISYYFENERLKALKYGR